MPAYIDINELKKVIKPADYYAKHLAKYTITKSKEWVVNGLCPFHADKATGSFSINLSSGAFKCFSCGAKGADIVSFHRQKYNLDFFSSLADIATGSKFKLSAIHQLESNKFDVPVKADIKKTQKIKHLLSEIVFLTDLSAEPARLYFSRRGLGKVLQDPPHDLFFHANLEYFEAGKATYYPALIAPLRNNLGEIISIHRTYLTQEGDKAPVSQPRKLMSPGISGATKGSAIRLYHPTTNAIGIAEGIETALAAKLMTQQAVWAAGSANSLANFLPPSWIENVIIFADNDSSGVGIQHAKLLTKRLSKLNIKCKILFPEERGEKASEKFDWLDFLNN